MSNRFVVYERSRRTKKRTDDAYQENYAVVASVQAMKPPFSELKQVAALVQTLCQDGSVVNGACIPADGGWASY